MSSFIPIVTPPTRRHSAQSRTETIMEYVSELPRKLDREGVACTR